MHTYLDTLPFGNLLAINKGPRSLTVLRKGILFPFSDFFIKNNVGTERKNELFLCIDIAVRGGWWVEDLALKELINTTYVFISNSNLYIRITLTFINTQRRVL